MSGIEQGLAARTGSTAPQQMAAQALAGVKRAVYAVEPL